jgi:hypothetical protein
MELEWRKTFQQGWQLWWDERGLRCAEIQPVKTNAWSLTLSLALAPHDFGYKVRHNTLEEAKEYTENLVRVLIIGGHHEDRRTS